MKELEKKLKRKIGALVVLGIFVAIALATPAFGWSGEPDGWSLNRQGSNTVTVVYVDYSSYVGIGTTSPNYNLHIHSSSENSAIQFTHAGTNQGIQNGAAIGLNSNKDLAIRTYESGTGGDILFKTDTGTEKMVITRTGNVGIGTVNPTARAHIIQTATRDAFRVDDRLSDSSPFVIDDEGNVGIGTDNPQNRLHIAKGNEPEFRYDTSIYLDKDTEVGNIRISINGNTYYLKLYTE